MTNPKPSSGAPAPALDLSGYSQVLVVKTGDVDGHTYRRGSRHTVDAGTLKALEDGGLIDPAQTKTAGQ